MQHEHRKLQNARSSAGRVLGLLKRKKGTTAVLLALILVTSTLEITIPFLTQRLIDGIIRSVKGLDHFALPALFASLAAIFVSVAATRVLRSVYNYKLFKTVTCTEDEVKGAAFENFLHSDMETLAKTNSGQVMGCLDRGAAAIYIILFEIFGQNLVPPLIIFTGVFGALLLKSWIIALTVFLPLPIYMIIVGRFSAPMHELEQEVNSGFERVGKEYYDIASNVVTVKKFSQEKREAGVQRELLSGARVPQYRAERNWAVIENIQTIIATAGRVIVIGLGGYFVLKSRCTLGEYVLFIALQDMLFGPMGQLSILLPKLRRNLARVEGLFEVLDRKHKIKDDPNAAPLPPLRGSVDVRNLSFRYPGAENWILRDVSFTVPAGATVALIGRSGTGKTTFMNLLLRCYDPQHGSISIDGIDIRLATQESLRNQIAVVPQEVDLFSRTIAENISYGSAHATTSDVESAARTALAHDFIRRSEEEYQTVVGERGLRLSGGERQRIGIARAILRDPEILLLDEATSHLDTESEHLIQRAMQRVARDRTCFIIAHRLSTVRHADLVVVFANGGVEAIGTHSKLMHCSPTYAKLHSVHSDPADDRISDESYDSELMELAS
ncbi:MAG TPA: ABC transporter ATP-binding protein [Bryobacteraceae bacterium]|jgi:ABC-type multidrug transport system fused ATPase/permease subunit|nr:ABC transporter ATP-binding protein [Bryobacteraceae bacterium]